MRRRITVAFEQVETTPMRQFRQAWDNAITGSTEWDMKRRRQGVFWCAADRPGTSDDALGIMVVPIYPGSEVPEDARCETCSIGIRELQEEMERWA